MESSNYFSSYSNASPTSYYSHSNSNPLSPSSNAFPLPNQLSSSTSSSSSTMVPPPQVTIKQIPEFFETTLGEALAARADQMNTFKLGPPDLCHIVKVHTKTNALVSSYHYVVGQPASSPGALATYIHDLIQLHQHPDSNSTPSANPTTTTTTTTTTTNTSSSYKITSALYCCYHPFAKLDVRVEVHVPGTVECHGINLNLKKVQLDVHHPTFWQELHIAAFFRTLDPFTRFHGVYQRSGLLNDSSLFSIFPSPLSLSTTKASSHAPTEPTAPSSFQANSTIQSKDQNDTSDDDLAPLSILKSNITSNGQTKSHFTGPSTAVKSSSSVSTLVSILAHHWSCFGPDPLVQSPSFTQHKGITILYHQLGELLGRWDLLQLLYTDVVMYLQQDPIAMESKLADALGLLAQVYLADGKDAIAAKVLYQGLKKYPNSSSLLITQVDFLLKKKQFDHAYKVATRLVSMHPLDFRSWQRLIQVYLALKKWSFVLLAMNVCPMFMPYIRDTLIIPCTTKPWIPKPPFDSDLLDPYPSFPPTSATSFPTSSSSAASASSSSSSSSSSFSSSTFSLFFPSFAFAPPPSSSSSASSGLPSSSNSVASQGNGLGLGSPDEVGPFMCMYNLLIQLIHTLGWEQTLKIRAEVFVMEHETHSSTTLQNEAPSSLSSSSIDTSSKMNILLSKRLCERWLDDLFICLYQDLSLHAMYLDQPQVKRSSQEWEQLADVSYRLRCFKDALQMYLACLATLHASRPTLSTSTASSSFSSSTTTSTSQGISVEVNGRRLSYLPRVLFKLLRCCEQLNEVMIGLKVMIKVLEHPLFYGSILDGVYGDIVIPNAITKTLFKFIQGSGLVFIQNGLMQLKPPTHIYKRLTTFLDHAERMKVKGVER